MAYIYDPKKLIINAGGKLIVGLDGDTPVKIEFEVPERYTASSDQYGSTTLHKTGNNNVIVTLVLSQASSGNTILSMFSALDRESDAGAFPLFIKDDNGDSLVTATKAKIITLPTLEFGAQHKTREWKILALNAGFFAGGIKTT